MCFPGKGVLFSRDILSAFAVSDVFPSVSQPLYSIHWMVE